MPGDTLNTRYSAFKTVYWAELENTSISKMKLGSDLSVATAKPITQPLYFVKGSFIKDNFVKSCLVKSFKKLLRNSSFLAGGFITSLYAKAAFAQSSNSVIDAIQLNSDSIIPLAVFGGAITFALLSAFWLMKERARIATQNQELRKSYAKLRADKERIEALVNVSDQKIIIWNSKDSKPSVMGSLSENCGAPQNDSAFAAFGKWLSPSSVMELEKAVSLLRKNGEQFNIVVETRNGTPLDSQGRVSGSYPFVRFYELGPERKTFASISREHKNLIAQFSLVESLFKQLPFPIWLRNSEKKLHWVNDAYSKAVDSKSAEDATNDNMQLFDASERKTIFNSTEKSGHFSGELPAIIAGDRKQMQTIEVGTDCGDAGIAIDRSDLDNVRTTLKETIASHTQTLDNLSTAVAIFDSKKNLSFYNASFQLLWGLNPGLLEDNPSNNDILEAMRATGFLTEMQDWKKWKKEQLEAYHSTEASSEQWHLTDGRTLRVISSPQNQGGISWVFENLTEQLELKSNYNRLMRLQDETIDHLSEAVAVFGSDGKLKLTNPTFEKLWNFDEETIEGKHIRDLSQNCLKLLKSTDEWETILLGITGVSDGRDDVEGRIEFLNGTILNYQLVRLPDAQTMLTLADMTASVNVERALQERNDALEESDGLKTRFIQHVSYELRAPLTSIAGFSEILGSDATGKLNPKQAEYIDYISRSSDVLKALIDDILDLASIDAGSMELDLVPTKINDCINESLDAVEDKLSRRQISVNVAVAKNSEKIIADPARIRQIIYNLLSNAIAASPDGTQISIDVSKVNSFIEISIADQGPGIPEKDKDKIFERFENAGATRNQKGPGLGLSIVKSFVELHGGNISVEDAGERGAKFIFRLPKEPNISLEAAE